MEPLQSVEFPDICSFLIMNVGEQESARLKSIMFVTGVPHVVGMDPIDLSCVTEETDQVTREYYTL